MLVCRRAYDEEINSIMELVIRTFTGEQDIPQELNYLPAEKQPHWFCAEENGKLVGTIAFFRESDGWHAGRIAIEPRCRGQHIGTRLISYALSEMFGTGAEEIRLEARPITVHILTGLGAQITGEPFPFYRSTCTPIRIKREDFCPHKSAVADPQGLPVGKNE